MNQKILIVCSVVPPYKDAVGESAVKLCDLLIERGLRCCILTSVNQVKQEYVYTLINTWGLGGIKKIINFAKKEKFEKIIFEYPTSLYKRNIFISFLPFLCKIFRLNTITYLHEYGNYSRLGKLRIFPILLFSDLILTTDSINYALLLKMNIAKSKVSVLSVGSNFRDKLFLESQTVHSSQEVKSRINILYFGYIMSGKGIENYVSFAEKYELDDIQFNIIGSLPEHPNSFAKELYIKIKNSPFIKYFGFVQEEELIKHFHSIDIVYLPYGEGVSERRTSFMTVMGFGKIVITTKPQIKINGLIDGENVFFIDELSNESFNSIITEIKALDDLSIKKIKESAHKWYMKNYSDEIFINKFVNIIS